MNKYLLVITLLILLMWGYKSNASELEDLINRGEVNPIIHYDLESGDIQACYMYDDQTAGYCTPYVLKEYIKFCLFKDGDTIYCTDQSESI